MKCGPRRLNVMWVITMVPAMLSGAYGDGANYVNNPNQVLWKFSEEMDVPHIPWAKPLAGGPVTATVIAPGFSWESGGGYVYRDVAELCVRLSVRVNPVMTADRNTIPYANQHNCAYPDLGDTPDVWMALVQERLQKPADVIVISKVLWTAFRVHMPAGGWEKGTKWSAFSADLRSPIVDRVRMGCGLFYINPYLHKGAGGDVSLYLPTGDLPPPEKGKEMVVPAAGEKVVLKMVDASDDLLRGLVGLKEPPPRQQDWTSRVYTGSLGRGRVLVVDYANETSPEHCLVPSSPAAANGICVYEYLMSFIARGVLWCAGRESPSKIQRIDADPKQGIKVRLTGRPSDTKLTVELRDTSGETGRVVKAWEAARTSLVLPKLKRGTYLVNAWLRNRRGDVLDWGSTRLDVTVGDPPPVFIKGIVTREAAACPGQPIAGVLELNGRWPSGDTLRLSVIDMFGRCLWRQEWDKPGEHTPYNMELDPGRSIAWILRAERAKGDEILEACEKTVCLSTKELDGDFAAVLWNCFGADERFNRQDLSLLRRIGFDSLYLVRPSFREACARANMRTLWNLDRVTGFSGQGFCKQAVGRWVSLYRDGAASSRATAPLALTFGDEAQYDSRSDGSTLAAGPASRDEDFRIFLGWWFDRKGGKLDLNVLNKAWGTAYKSEEEIVVRSLEALRTANGRAQGVCEGLWMEWQFHRLLAESQKAAQDESPLTYYGDEGAGNMYTGDGHDYYLLFRDMTLCQVYDTEAGPFLVKSFSGPNTLRGMWTGNYSYYVGAVDEEWMRSRPWRSLFYGMNSEWWWMQSMSIRADGKPIPCFAQYGEEIRRIKAGPATLMLKVAKPYAPQVAVLYSPNTVHVHTFDHKGPGPHPMALATVGEGLIRSGYAFKLLHPSQLDDSTELGSDYRALVLPAILAVSEKQAETIRKFVEQGGLLIADQVPEQYFNELGVPYERDPFRSVFARGTDATQYTFGRGKAVFISEPFSLSHLIRYKDLLGQTWSEKSGKPLARLFREWIESATGCKPPVSVTLPDGSPLVDAEISPFQDGPALYVGIDRNGRYWEGEQCRWLRWDGYQEMVDAVLTFPSAAHVYDVTRGEYVGQGPTVKVSLTSYPRLFAALPARVKKIELSGCRKSYHAGETINVDLKVPLGRDVRWRSVVHLALYDDKGDVVAWSERNVVTDIGQGRLVLPLALDEKPGIYTLKARDVASGVEVVRKVTVVRK